MMKKIKYSLKYIYIIYGLYYLLSPNIHFFCYQLSNYNLFSLLLHIKYYSLVQIIVKNS